MSVIVKDLTKIYGAQKALDSISFEARKGEIMGFLGPNGAGKSTTMKIITCFIPQTNGSVSVCGFDTTKDPIEVRRKIGYLPEHNPLYKNMYVREYLEFAGRLHKLSNIPALVKDMIERTGLGAEQHKVIGALSKGYRQRVGLAQAMLHNPEVLILDEPTTGLDPNQIVDIRNLIREFGKSKTVIFSTHIMQEVEALCDHVVIINKGTIVANDTIGDLQQRVAGETVVTIAFAENLKQTDKIKAIPGVHKVTSLPLKESGQGSRFEIRGEKGKDIRADISKFASENQLTIVEMNREVVSIEDIFHNLTQTVKS